jgi:hypothetical protein
MLERAGVMMDARDGAWGASLSDIGDKDKNVAKVWAPAHWTSAQKAYSFQPVCTRSAAEATNFPEMHPFGRSAALVFRKEKSRLGKRRGPLDLRPGSH